MRGASPRRAPAEPSRLEDMMNNELRGVYCAVATPLKADLSPDTDRLVQQCKALLANGCHGLGILGSTGEANSFSTAERMAILEAVVASGIAPEVLMPGTGVSAYTETVALTRHALSLGVTNALVLPPFYYKGVSDQGLIDAFSRVVDGIADDRARILFYHIPPIAQVAITFPLIEAMLKRYPATFVGLKDSSGDLANMQAVAANFPTLSVFAGADPLMLSLLKTGGAGCITAAANLVSAELRTVYDGWRDPAKAAEIEAAQERIVAIRTIANAYPQLPTIKALLARRTGEEGWSRVRPPFVALSGEEKAGLEGLVGAVKGFR
jgi:4-hydroxy-tetrahydrodipicolinate synthase